MNFKRFAAGLIAMSLVCSSTPASSFNNKLFISRAEDSVETQTTEFDCGKFVKMTLNDGVAHVSLKKDINEITGAVWIYNYDNEKAPWDNVMKDIETLIIDEGVTDIGACAFEGAENLKTLVLPSTLKSIRFCTFQYCYSLKSVVLPSSLQKLVDGAFLNTGIEKIIYAGSEGQWNTIDKGEQYIGPQKPEILYYVNAGIAGDTAQWSYESGSDTLKISGTGSIYDFDETNSPWSRFSDNIKNIEIDHNINRIGNNAFANMNLLSSVSMSGITSVGDNAFKNCDNLSELVLPDNLSEIGKNAFSANDRIKLYCTPGTKAETTAKKNNISYIVVEGSCGASTAYAYNEENNELIILGSGKMADFNSMESQPWHDIIDSVKKISISNGITYIGKNAFSGASAVTSIDLSDSIEKIGSNAFSGCSCIDTIFLPDALVTIEAGAFSDCKSLKYCITGNKLKTIGSAAFFVGNPENELTIYYKGSLDEWNAIDKTSNNSYIDDAVMITNADGGKYSNNVWWIYSPSDKKINIIGEGRMSSYEHSPFEKYASEAETVVFSDKIENVGDNAFNGMFSLTDITLNDNITSIGISAFEGCTSLKNIKLPPNITNIGTKAFSGCSILSDLNLSDSIVSIGSYSFDNCDSLSYIKIPESVKTIGDHAFFECDRLTEVYFETQDVAINEKAFGFISENRVKSDLAIITFENTTAKEYADKNGIKVIATKPGCSCGENIVYSFDEATGILTVFGHGATFDYDNGSNKAPWNKEGYVAQIKEVVFSDEITRIGNSFLQNARSLERIVLPSSLESIGNQAFRDTKNIESVRLPSELKTIGRNAFMGSQSLSKLFFEGEAPEILGDNNGNNRTFMDAYGTEIYAHLSMKGWDTFRDNSGIKDDIIIIDLDKTSISDELTIKNIPVSVIVGETYPLEIDIDPLIASEFIWESSNPEVVQVSNKGMLTAFGEGESEITVKSKYDDNISYSFIISSSDKNKLHSSEKADAIPLEGKNYFNNISANNYNEYTTFCTKYINSFLTQNPDGSFYRIENVNNENIYIESYDKDLKLKGIKTINSELAHFLGYYHGQDGYHYFLFGQNNMEMSDELEVYRLVRYDNDFTNRVSVPIDNQGESSVSHLDYSNGVARMTESDKYLYVTTAHTVYQGHQENIIFVFNKETLERIYNTAFYTRSSHSFNGFIDYDGEYIYLADHGDYNPRAMLVQRFPKNTFTMANNRKMNVFDITIPDHPVWGDNYTGATIGGFAASDSTTLLTGTSIDQTLKEVDENTQSNIFLTITDSSLTHAETKWLTNYPENSGIHVRTPQIVKMNNNQFLIMWEEYNKKSNNTSTYMVVVDQNGTLLTQPEKTDLRLSDCQPIVASDGTVMWYVTDNTKPIVYKVNPYSFEKEDTNKIVYTYDTDTATLHISGKGNIPNYTDLSERDWIKQSGADPDKVKNIIIDGDIYIIGDHVFENLPEVEKIIFNSNTYSIGEKAFAECENLKNVILPDNITNLGAGVFNNDDSIEKLIIPESLTNADFGWMYSAEDVDIYYIGSEKQWKEITSDLYDSTKELKNIIYNSNAGKCGEQSFWVYDPTNNTLEVYGEKTIDKQDEGKYPWSNYNNDVKEIIVSGNFDSVPDNAFVDFKETEHFIISGDVESLGKNSFAGNEKADYVIIKPSLKDIGEKSIGYDSDFNKKDDFSIIGTKGSEIEKYAKENDIEFIAVDGYCGDNLAYAFNKDTGKLTFYGSGDMYNFEDKKQPWAENADKIKSIEFSEELTRIGNNAFNSHNNLNNIIIPESVKEIGSNAFYNCEVLDTITIKSTDYKLDETSFFNGYGIDRTINFVGTEEQWKKVSTESENESTDKINFNYVEPPIPVNTTGSTTSTINTTTTSTVVSSNPITSINQSDNKTTTTSKPLTSSTTNLKSPAIQTTANTLTTKNDTNSLTTIDKTTNVSTSMSATVLTKNISTETVLPTSSQNVSTKAGSTQISSTDTSHQDISTPRSEAIVTTPSDSASNTTSVVNTSKNVNISESTSKQITSINPKTTNTDNKISELSNTVKPSSSTTTSINMSLQTTASINSSNTKTNNLTTDLSSSSQSTTTSTNAPQQEKKLSLGDVNADGKVDASDASETLLAYSIYSTGGVPDYLSKEQLRVADVNSDGSINASDASQILVYYSYLSTGGKASFEEFLDM